HELRMPPGRHAQHRDRALTPVPLAEHADARCYKRGRGWRVLRGTGALEQPAQRAAPAEVGEARQCAALEHALTLRDATPDRHAEALCAARPLSTRLDGDADAVEGAARGGRGALVHVEREPHAGAVVAATAGRGSLVVERRLQELHSASAGLFVV